MADALPRVLAIGGLDPCGGAGITADARILEKLGAHPMAVATCLTDQDRSGMRGALPVEAEWLRRMLDAAIADGPIGAIKTGMFASREGLETVHAAVLPLVHAGVPLVVDPVLSATAGGWHQSVDVVAAYRETLVPFATLVTPNLEELAVVVPGAGAVLKKGGHAEGPEVVDRLILGGRTVEIRHERIATGPLHGTGCVLASAIAAFLAMGRGLEAACREAIAVVERCVRASRHGGKRPEPLRLA
jgi:hydroxymethylpyrimidine/phosphomethylpyrimidine kinase